MKVTHLDNRDNISELKEVVSNCSWILNKISWSHSLNSLWNIV